MKRKTKWMIVLFCLFVFIFVLTSCDGSKSKTAYQMYLDAYVSQNGSVEGALTEREWLNAWNSEKTTEIRKVEIVCGSVIVTFEDDSVYTMENVCPDAGHLWETDGHQKTCNRCGYSTVSPHDFGTFSDLDDPYRELVCECGLRVTVGKLLGYQVIFVCDEGVSVKVFDGQDYSVPPTSSDTAYSRDKNGKLTKDGEGQVNFEVVFEGDRSLDGIAVYPISGYKNCKGKADTGVDNVYRITKITSDLIVVISAEQDGELAGFGSTTDGTGRLTFRWDANDGIAFVDVRVESGGEVNEYTVRDASQWTVLTEADRRYDFTFTPHKRNGESGTPIECSRYLKGEPEQNSLVRVEISTRDGVFPTCDFVTHPEGCWGEGITNNQYVYSTVEIVNSNGDVLFDSTDGRTDDERFSGARVKVRGNTSAYTEKQPYKIKLDKKTDLLAGLVADRPAGAADKDWVLIATGGMVSQVFGWSVSKTVGMDWTPAYTYVELYLNGDYRGIYILCENIKRGNGSENGQARCAVDGDGFVVELDAYWWKEDLSFVTPFVERKPLHFTFKYPDSDDLDENADALIYIRDYLTAFETALSGGGDSYLDYIDLPSFVKWLVAQDILGSYDAGGTNIFLTKKDSTDNSKLMMGPLWDFDSVRNRGVTDAYATIHTHYIFYYSVLTEKEEFSALYREILTQAAARVTEDLSAEFDLLDGNYDFAVQTENARWKTSFSPLGQQKASIFSWLSRHLEWMLAQ